MALPRPLAVLVRPADALDPLPSLQAAVAVVLLAGVVSSAGLFATGLVFADDIDRQVTVPNEDRPADWVCEDDGTGMTFSGCDEPRTVQLDLGSHAQQVVGSWAAGAVPVFLLLWPTLAGVLHVVTGNDDAFEETLRATAFGFLPTVLVSVARPAYFAVVGVNVSAGSPEAMTAAVREAVFPGPPVLLAVAVVALAWQAYITAGGLHAAKGTPMRFGFVLVAAALATAALVGVYPRETYLPPMSFLLVLAVPMLLFPRPWLQFQKEWELIGFRNARQVEPEDWYVTLHRLGGTALFALVTGAVGGFRYLL